LPGDDWVSPGSQRLSVDSNGEYEFEREKLTDSTVKGYNVSGKKGSGKTGEEIWHVHVQVQVDDYDIMT